MKKLLIICLCLTVCSMGLWGFSRVRARGYSIPVAVAEQQEAPENTGPEPAQAEISVAAAPSLQVGLPDGLPLGGWEENGSANPTDEPLADAPPTAAPLLALTFDDGPSKDYTQLLLDGLRERGVHVTFFLVGVRAEKAPELVLQAYEDGHAIGGHSYDHTSYLTKLSTEKLATQVKSTADIIAGITGGGAPFMLRPPYGAINAKTALKTGKVIMLWNIDPRDWSVRNAEKIRRHILDYAVDGGVVILHDTFATTVEGALAAIDELLENGWQLVTLPELYEARGIPLQAGGIYRSPESYILPGE